MTELNKMYAGLRIIAFETREDLHRWLLKNEKNV